MRVLRRVRFNIHYIHLVKKDGRRKGQREKYL